MSKHEREKEREEHEEHEKRRRGGGLKARERKEERDHEKRNAGVVVARKRGGGIKPEDTRPKAEGTHANYPEIQAVPREHRKIRVQKRRGGKVDGKKAERRIDRRARGGGIGPASHHAPKRPQWPYSGAEAPDMPYTKGGNDSKPEGKGGDHNWNGRSS